MIRAVAEPKATPRGRMSEKRRQHIFTENFGVCCLCNVKIDRRGERWIVEHKIPLGLSGKDTNPNCAPAHYECAQEKTKGDMQLINKAKRANAAATVRTPERKAAEKKYDWKLRRYLKPSVQI